MKIYRYAPVPELLDAQSRADDLRRVNGPTYEAVARCEVLHDLLKERVVI